MEISGNLIISKVRWKRSPVEMVARAILPQTLRLFAVILAVVTSSEFKDTVIRAQCQAACLQKVGTVDNLIMVMDSYILSGAPHNSVYICLFYFLS